MILKLISPVSLDFVLMGPLEKLEFHMWLTLHICFWDSTALDCNLHEGRTRPILFTAASPRA